MILITQWLTINSMMMQFNLQKTMSLPIIPFHLDKYTMIESSESSNIWRGGRARFFFDKLFFLEGIYSINQKAVLQLRLVISHTICSRFNSWVAEAMGVKFLAQGNNSGSKSQLGDLLVSSYSICRLKQLQEEYHKYTVHIAVIDLSTWYKVASPPSHKIQGLYMTIVT